MKLKLEINATSVDDKPMHIGGTAVYITPPLDGNFWLARVRLTKKQAVICFPKFSTIGIGFQHEKDWNTNLPYGCPAVEIWEHIRHNKADKSIKRERGIAAIEMLREFAVAVKGPAPA